MLLNRSSPVHLNLPERLFFWDCVSDSDYKCMMFAVDLHLKRGRFITGDDPIQQYHGKWPFLRILGMQEIISVVFSLCFTIPHVMFLIRSWNINSNSLIQTNRYYATLGILSGTSSALFHSRDTWITERLDYHFALAYIICTFCVNCLELMKSPKGRDFVGKSTILTFIRNRIFILGILVCLAHILYLNLVLFDYGWNMTVAVVFQSLASICWIVQYWEQIKGITSSRNDLDILDNHIVKGLAVVGISILGGVLEVVWDDPPILFLLDSHALFHILICINLQCWYSFLETEYKTRLLYSGKQH